MPDQDMHIEHKNKPSDKENKTVSPLKELIIVFLKLGTFAFGSPAPYCIIRF